MRNLMQAIINNNLIVVQKFLSNPENDLNSLNDIDQDDGHTALQRAAKEGHIEIMAALIAAGAEIDKANHAGATALYIAAYENKLVALRYLLQHDASVDKATNTGTTPLMIAANQGNFQAMQLLLRAGAKVDQKNNVKVTALFIAAQVGNFLGVKTLLAHNANYDEPTPFGNAFEIASKGNHIVTVDLFKSFFANQISLQNQWQNEIKYETSHLLCALDEQIKMLSLTPDTRSSCWVTVQRNPAEEPLELCVRTSNSGKSELDTFELLWKAQPRSFEELTYSGIPICLAAEGGQVDLIKLLLSWDVGVNATLSTGESALYFAASTGEIPAMQLLLTAGAQVNLANNEGRTPCFIAARTGQLMALALLRKEKANIDQPSQFGNTPLMAALATNQISAALLLVEWGANVNHANNEKFTPLINAAIYAEPVAIQMLLNAGAEIDYQDNDGMTALLHATAASQLDAIQLLIYANANIELTDKKGKSALLYAAEIGNPAVVKTLLAYHSPNDYQRQIDIALETATRLGHQAVIKVLKEYITDNAQQINWQNKISENTELLLLQIEKKVYQLSLLTQILNDKNINALHTFVQHNHIPLMEAIIKHPIRLLTLETVDAHTPYHFAVQNGQTEALVFILFCFTSPREAIHFAKSHFYFAAQNGHIGVMRMLNFMTENVDLVHTNGLTPLCIAAFQGHDEAVRYLLANRANADFCSPLGTAMQIAERNHCIKVVDVLKKYFANRISVRQQWWQEIEDDSREFFDDLTSLGKDVKTDHNENKLFYAIEHHDLAEVQRLLAWEFQDPIRLNAMKRFFNNALGDATESGQVAIMKALIAAGADPHQIDEIRYSSLSQAVRYGHLEAARVLVESGVTVIPAPNERNSLCAAYKAELIQFLLDQGVDPNSAEEGKTAFYIAASADNVAGMLLLIHANALIDTPDNEGITPLIIAAKEGQIEAMRVLLAYLPNDTSIDVALKIAAENDHPSAVHFLNHFIENKSHLKSKWLLEFNERKQKLVTQTRMKLTENKKSKNENALISAAKIQDFIGVRELLAGEFNTPQKINAHEEDGTTALHIACMQGDIRIMHALIQAKAEVNQAKKDGMTPLNIAAQYGHAAACFLLISSNAKIDMANIQDATPLYHAALNGHDQVVELLLNSDASVDRATIHHRTPLIIATLQGHANIVRNLIAYQANLKHRSPCGTALEIANATKQTVIVELLNQGQSQQLKWHCEIQQKKQELINQLTKVIQDSKSYAFKATIFPKKLINAVKSNSLANVLPLLTGKYKNPKYIQLELDENGDSALHLAAKFGYAAILHALIKAHAIVDQLNNNGATPLYLAAQAGKRETMQLLLNAGASVKSILPQGETVLIATVIQDRVDLVLTLLAYHADVNISATKGGPLNDARLYDQQEVFNLLKYFSNSANKDRLKNLWRNAVNNQTEQLLLQVENELTANALSLLTSQKTAVTPMIIEVEPDSSPRKPTNMITDKSRKLIFPKAVPAMPAIEFLTIAQNAIVVGKELGSGSFGRVMYGTLHEHLVVAVKELKPNRTSDEYKQHLLHEAKIMANLRSPDIVSLFGVCTTGPLRLVIEYMAGGTLLDLLYSSTAINWQKRLKFAIDICRGLYYLSVQNPVILHRDLKSENILLDEYMRAKIADFGFADIKKKSILTSSSTKKVSCAKGTPLNMAPELFFNEPKYSEASDLYAFSIILWQIASRKEPYRDIDDNPKLFMELIKFGTREEIPHGTPPKFGQLIVKCWENRSNHRPPVKEVLVELQEIAVKVNQFAF